MKYSSIVAIVLRLFAIQWAVTGIVVSFGTLGIGLSTTPLAETSGYQWFQMLAAPVWYILIGCVAWFFGSLIARRVVPAADPEIRGFDLKVSDLYGLGLLVIGATTFLSHLAPAINWIYYMILNRTGDAMLHGQNGRSMYDLAKEAIPCVVGAMIACASPKLGTRLAIGARKGGT